MQGSAAHLDAGVEEGEALCDGVLLHHVLTAHHAHLQQPPRLPVQALLPQVWATHPTATHALCICRCVCLCALHYFEGECRYTMQ